MTHHSAWLVPDTLGEENNAYVVTWGYVVQYGTILELSAFDEELQLILFSGTNTERVWLMWKSYTKPVSQFLQKTTMFTKLCHRQWKLLLCCAWGLPAPHKRSQISHQEAPVLPSVLILAKAVFAPGRIAGQSTLSRNIRVIFLGIVAFPQQCSQPLASKNPVVELMSQMSLQPNKRQCNSH